MEERIIQLETLLTLQDATIAGLNTEIYRQQQDLSALQRRLETLENKLQDVQSKEEEIGGNERPPHY
jgi:uncharacterized coiled-coil protein SlyX